MLEKSREGDAQLKRIITADQWREVGSSLVSGVLVGLATAKAHAGFEAGAQLGVIGFEEGALVTGACVPADLAADRAGAIRELDASSVTCSRWCRNSPASSDTITHNATLECFPGETLQMG